MFKKFGIPFFTVAAACAILTSCSSDSNSAGPAEQQPASSADGSDGCFVADEFLKSSSSTIASSSSSDVIPGSSDATPTSSATVAESSSSSIAAPDDTPSDTPADPALSDTPADPTAFWSDEFQGDALDITKWSYEIGTGENGWGNGEWQYYTDRTENAYVKDGYLHIRAALETDAAAIANDFGGKKYTSARIITRGKFDFAYGTIKARIALPVGKGIWPAFWMLGANSETVGWPACGEIDIIEAVNDESVVYGTHHWNHEGSHAQYGNSTKQHFDGHYELDITEFHDYKMTWDKNAISMYVDDFMYQKIDITDASSDMGTFHKAFYFILNVAVGGGWPGFDIDDTQFPNEMIVDYIRVYKN